MNRLIYFCLLSVTSSLVAATTSSIEWFSDKPRQMPALLADPAEAQLKVGYLLRGEKKSYLHMGLGGQLDIARKELPTGSIAVQARAQALSRFEFFSHSFDLHGTDFIGGLSTSYQKEKWIYEILLAHQSSHLGDDIQSRALKAPVDFSYEYARILASFSVSEKVRLYSGVQFNFRSVPATLKWKPTYILGGDWHPFVHFWDIYFATDLRFVGVNSYSPNLSLACGYELGEKAGVQRRQRIQLELYNGYSQLGQYFDNREFYLFLGFMFAL